MCVVGRESHIAFPDICCFSLRRCYVRLRLLEERVVVVIWVCGNINSVVPTILRMRSLDLSSFSPYRQR